MAGSENRVTIVIDGKNDAGGAFASATAEAEALKRVLSDLSNNEGPGIIRVLQQQVRSMQEAEQANRAVERSWLSVARGWTQVIKGDQVLADARKGGGDAGDAFSGSFISRVRSAFSGIGGDGNIFTRMLRLLTPFGGGGGGFLGGIGGLIPGLSSSSWGGAAAGAGILTALSTGLLGAIPGILSAITGVGAFGALAFPTVSKILGFPGQLSTLQGNLTAAQQQLLIDRRAGAPALDIRRDQIAIHQDHQAIHQAWAGLSPAQRAGVQGVQGLQGLFGQASQAFGPTLTPIFNNAVGIASNLIPMLQPLAKAVAPAIQGLLNQFGQFVTSPGFKTFMTQIGQLAGPWVTTLGQTFGQLAVAVGKLLMAFSNPNAMRIFRIAIDLVSWALQALAWFIRTNTAAIVRLAHDIAAAFDRVRHDAAHLAADFAHWFDVIRHAVAGAAHSIANEFDRMRHDIAAAWDRIAHDIASKWDSIRHEIAAKIDAILHEVASKWDEIRHRVAAAIDGMRHDIASKFDQIVATIKAKVANFPSLLIAAGKALIQGLINGILSMLGPLGSAIGTIAGFIASHLPHSPAKLGPLSGAGDPLLSGREISRRLATGMLSGRSEVGAAAAALAGSAGLGGGAGGGGVVIRIQPGGGGLDRLFMDWLKYSIRASGGDPRILTQKVRLA